MIEPLLQLSSQIIAQKTPEYNRFLFEYIDDSERLIPCFTDNFWL